MEDNLEHKAPAGCKFIAVVLLLFCFFCFSIGVFSVGKAVIKYILVPFSKYIMSLI